MVNGNGKVNWLNVIIGSMITVFIATTGIMASSIYNVGKDRESGDRRIEANVNLHEAKLAKMEECMTSIKDDLREIKSILKRTSPYERAQPTVRDGT